jgi:hypothetical protein
MVIPMAALIGISLLSLTFESQDDIIGGSSFLGSAFVAALIGIGTLVLLSHLFTLSGRLMGGKADSAKFRAAMAWSGVPIVASLLLFLPLFFGLNSELLGITGLSVFIRWIFAGWSLYLLISMISEIQNFSILRSVFQIILVGIVITIPLLFINVLIGTGAIL